MVSGVILKLDKRLRLHTYSVIFVNENENENENCQKRENNEFVNEN